jgi:NDP-sugar pyrophosphorylase family protein
MLPVVVLAGGLATRLRPVTKTIPKSLVEVNGVPFVLHQLQLFQQKGISQVHFCLGYLGHMVQAVVNQSPFATAMHISYSYDGDKLLGTGGAIVNAFDHLPNTFFITYGDSYLDIDYAAIHAFYQQQHTGNQGLMTVYHNQGRWDTSNVVFTNNHLQLYSKKNKVPQMQYIDYGLSILSKTNFNQYTPGTTLDLADVYETLSRNQQLLGYQVHTRFYEIGSFQGIQDFVDYLNQNQ